MVYAGLISDLEERSTEPNEKRRYDKMTEFGYRVLEAEEQRLKKMLEHLVAVKRNKNHGKQPFHKESPFRLR